jgi:hypothetical protein
MGSASTIRIFGFIFFSASETPAKVPPEPTDATKPATLPSVCRQISGAVLHRLAGIHELGLAEDVATGFLGSTLQFDQGGVADRFDDVFVDVHVREILPVCCQMRHDPRARKAKVEAGLLPIFGPARYFDFANTTWRTSIFPDRNPASQYAR